MVVVAMVKNFKWAETESGTNVKFPFKEKK